MTINGVKDCPACDPAAESPTVKFVDVESVRREFGNLAVTLRGLAEAAEKKSMLAANSDDCFIQAARYGVYIACAESVETSIASLTQGA